MPQKATHPETAKRLEEKAKEILTVLNSPEGIDLWKLRGLAISEGGLVNGTFYQNSRNLSNSTHQNYLQMKFDARRGPNLSEFMIDTGEKMGQNERATLPL